MNFFNSVINFFKDGGLFLYPLALIFVVGVSIAIERYVYCLLYTSPSPRDGLLSRMPSSA